MHFCIFFSSAVRHASTSVANHCLMLDALWKIMRKITCLLSLVLVGIVIPSLTAAHHSRVGLGVYFGPGFYYSPPYYYPPPVYYPSQPVIIQQQAPVYIEQIPQQVTPTPPQAAGDWYYCASSKTYYPYAANCPEPWQRVSPVPPSPLSR